MLTDSGTNAMSDNQVAAMFRADDAYAGSQSFTRLLKAVQDVLGKEFLLPVHQGRAAENIICRTFIKPGQIVPMNYHFTTALAHITENGGKIAELLCDDALEIQSTNPFKGNIDIHKLEKCIQDHGSENIPFIRMEASTNLIGGQPFSIHNLQQVREVADRHGIMLVLDASLLGENAFLVKQREKEWKNASLAEILKTITGLADLVYFSARKLSSSRGGGICTNNRTLYAKMETLIPLFEGFLTYGGISVREIEAMAVGLYETQDETIIRQSPDSIAFLVNDLQQKGIPVVTPAGVLGCHVDAMSFCKHIPQSEYPAGALAAAFYLISGIRGMERWRRVCYTIAKLERREAGYESRSGTARRAAGGVHCRPQRHGACSGGCVRVQQVHRAQGRCRAAAQHQPCAVRAGARRAGPQQGRAPPAGRGCHPAQIQPPLKPKKDRCTAQRSFLLRGFSSGCFHPPV